MSVWNEESLTALLNRNDIAVERAIVRIYERQTEDEKNSETTKHTNNIGFSGADASPGTYYAKWVLSGKILSGIHLTKARKMAVKYRKQLLQIIKENQEPKG